MPSTAMPFATTPITSLSEMKERHSCASGPQLDGIKLPSGSNDFLLQRPIGHNPCRAVVVDVIDRCRDDLILSRCTPTTDRRCSVQATPSSIPIRIYLETNMCLFQHPHSILSCHMRSKSNGRRQKCFSAIADGLCPRICTTTLRRPLRLRPHSGRR